MAVIVILLVTLTVLCYADDLHSHQIFCLLSVGNDAMICAWKSTSTSVLVCVQ